MNQKWCILHMNHFMVLWMENHEVVREQPHRFWFIYWWTTPTVRILSLLCKIFWTSYWFKFSVHFWTSPTVRILACRLAPILVQKRTNISYSVGEMYKILYKLGTRGQKAAGEHTLTTEDFKKQFEKVPSGGGSREYARQVGKAGASRKDRDFRHICIS